MDTAYCNNSSSNSLHHYRRIVQMAHCIDRKNQTQLSVYDVHLSIHQVTKKIFHMIVIHYPTAYKALDCFIDLFNEKAEKSTQRLRTGAVMTAKEIIRIYGISLLKANGYQEVNKEKLPSLQTNNKQLAKLVKCSSRTIQRHILKLRSAGIVTNKIFHCSNSNF